MTIHKINILKLTQKVFGINGIVAKTEGVANSEINYSGIETIEVAEHSATSILGTPIFETLRIKIPGTNNYYEFEDVPLMSISMSKNIVRSRIQGRKGTVKEYINDGDYVVQIKGLLCKHNSEQKPIDKINELNNLVSYNQALKVESKLLNTLGIYNLVIKRVDYRAPPQVNVQPYVLSCLSDEPIELSL